MAFSDSDHRQKRRIRDLFTGIAAHYDRVNRLLSLGQDQRWRRLALKMAQVPSGGRVLDVATGTGDMALLLLEDQGHPRVIGTDLTPAMLREAQAKAGEAVLPLVVSDGLALSFTDSTFDAVTSAFMMRNVPDVAAAFREQLRVVRPGGRVVCLEMTWPQRFPMKWLFALYFFGLSPLLGRLITGTHEPYRYLPQSVKQFLSPSDVALIMTEVGFQSVSWRSLMAGTVTLHLGIKPLS